MAVANPLSAQTVEQWLTKGDRSVLLARQPSLVVFGSGVAEGMVIAVDTQRKFQRIDGFGFALTGSSAQLLGRMEQSARTALLRELFATGTGIGVSELRLSIGASDLSPTVSFYDDVPAGQTDPSLDHFDLGADKQYLIPLLQEILAISPHLRIMATPWSAPLWMKTNGKSVGGSLKPDCYKAYAAYFVKYIQDMGKAGIRIDAVTPQNEPLNPNNNPSMAMTAQEEGAFIKNALAPAFQAAGLNTKIIVYDHNCDNTSYAETLLRDAAVKNVVAGTAFHLYAGDINNMGVLAGEFPDRNVYFTEQYTAATGDFGGDLRWHTKNVVVGALRNRSRNVIEWNLANDPAYGPHTPGGCSTCKGGLTINGSGVVRNVSYYIIAQVSKFVPPGSVRVWSESKGDLNTAAFVTPAGKTVLLVENDGATDATFSIAAGGASAPCKMPGGAVATFVW